MPRMPRIDAPGALHHVMIRGLERREIFRNDADRRSVVDRLARLVPLWGGDCFAWVLMGNHVHLVLRTRVLPLAWLMRRLNTGFAVGFNRRYERVGYLFQNRFKSRLVEHEADLLNLIRYVHLNPVRSGQVPDLVALERFPWSGHGSLIGARPPLGFESLDRTLSLFADDRATARRRLRDWMAMGLEQPAEASAATAEDVEVRPQEQPCERKGASAGGREARPCLDDVIEAICRHFSTSTSEVARGARNGRASQARAVIAFVAVVRRGLPISEVAVRVGVSPQAVGKSLERGARLVRIEEPRPRGWS
jgi:REP element-mobilizing transposase RayT